METPQSQRGLTWNQTASSGKNSFFYSYHSPHLPYGEKLRLDPSQDRLSLEKISPHGELQILTHGSRSSTMPKPVPYFPLYAANFIASKPYRLMSLQERGLWITLYMEFWVNGSLPSDVNELSKLLGFGINEVKNALSRLQFSFVEEVNGELVCKELEEYRAQFNEKREKQRLGGIVGAQKKKARNKQESTAEGVLHVGTPEGLPQGSPKGSLNYINLNSVTSNQLTRESINLDSNKEWLEQFNDESIAVHSDYQKASRGC